MTPRRIAQAIGARPAYDPRIGEGTISMALDAVGELLGGVFRVIGRMLFELVVELLLYGTGHLLLKPFYRGKQPSDGLCTLVGLLAWAAFAVVAFMAYRYVQSPA